MRILFNAKRFMFDIKGNYSKKLTIAAFALVAIVWHRVFKTRVELKINGEVCYDSEERATELAYFVSEERFYQWLKFEAKETIPSSFYIVQRGVNDIVHSMDLGIRVHVYCDVTHSYAATNGVPLEVCTNPKWLREIRDDFYKRRTTIESYVADKASPRIKRRLQAVAPYNEEA